jgi:hypothetical protein
MNRQYVAIDLHLHRSVIVRENAAGEKMGVMRIDNDPLALAEAMREAVSTPKSRSRRPTVMCATRRHMTGWAVRAHLRPVAAGR